jgi:chromosome segregation protein
VFLKSLTLRGFKSFADKTTLEFEPGVMVVVGPNGSGKSNLVDAIAWVLGAQGPRTLRGGKMDDVIFAGTPHRAALGRAEVSLTIDNAAGLLPIAFGEVTITRTLFRDGDSEYSLNGAPCRLLDVQELLSDTGIGRQQHVIVGQGQIDAVLNAKPEDRRAIVEEAAGVLKYRKRREKAERRLEATEGSLVRLHDLLREVRRGLGPLERQADAARRHDGVVAELTAIRRHLAGRELAGLQARARRLADEAARLAAEERALRSRLASLDVAVIEAEARLPAAGRDPLGEALGRLDALRERARGFRVLVEERRRSLARDLDAAADAGLVASLVSEAASVRAELAALEPEAATIAERLREAAAQRDRLAGRVAGEEQARHRARAELARAEAALARAEAHRDALAHDAGARPPAELLELDGVLGVLGELVEVDVEARDALAAALGDRLGLLVVRGEDAALRVLDHPAAADRRVGVLVADPHDRPVTPGATLAPAGCRPLVGLVRATVTGLAAPLAEMLAGCVLWDGPLPEAVAVSAQHPDLVVCTPRGGRCRAGRELWDGPPRTAAAWSADAALAAVEAAQAERAERAAALEAVGDHRAELEAHQALTRRHEVAAAALDERRRVLADRLARVTERLARDPDARAAAEAARQALAAQDAAYRRVAGTLDAWLTRVDGLAERIRRERARQAERTAAARAELDGLRSERLAAERRLAELGEQARRTGMEAAETQARLEACIERIRSTLDCEPEATLEADLPAIPEGTTPTARARELERELRVMGPVNPLAIQEYEALRERHEFLTRQLEDVKAGRRELQRVIRAVDREIVATFGAAFTDVERHFADLFHTLFPGGSGRLVLTDPDDLLHTGIEIEARPSGKNTRRLSLLSGGERSLVAMAFLFAVFRARPSPFYVLDEVEAALDDVNLHRFLDLVHSFRDEAQLVIVSHQKRTMEAADCLYGVSMPPGGSSRVVSQRLRPRDDAPDEIVLTEEPV